MTKQQSFWNRIKTIFTRTKSQSDFLPYRHNIYSLEYNPISQNLKTLSPHEFMTFGIFSRALQLLANDIAKINFHHFKLNNKTNTWEIFNNSKLNYIFNIKPNSIQTPWEFKKGLIWNLLLYGCCPIFKLENDNELESLILIEPNLISLKETEKGSYYEYWDNQANQVIPISTKRIIWINYETISGFKDANIRSLFKSTFNKLRENELSLINQVKNNFSATTFLKAPEQNLSEDQIKDYETRLTNLLKVQKENGYAGMILEDGWNVESGGEHISSGVDFPLRNAIGKEVASMFGIPPQKLGIEDPNKYNSSAELSASYVDNAIKPLLINVLQKLTTHLIFSNNQKLDFKPTDLLSMDVKSIQEFASKGINNGFLTPNEARIFIGLEPVKGGDRLLINSTLIPLDTIQEHNLKAVERPPNKKGEINE